MKQITIYTDGACSGNPGPGGWGRSVKKPCRWHGFSGGPAGYDGRGEEVRGAENDQVILASAPARRSV